ncbi:ribosome biogenesis protein ytm1 [Blastocladiella emersonii ATCC 22665]|nr:ribosome biogenesis protein ytm1 [Blastocladiella emersonii ATCC 22665]
MQPMDPASPKRPPAPSASPPPVADPVRWARDRIAALGLAPDAPLTPDLLERLTAQLDREKAALLQEAKDLIAHHHGALVTFRDQAAEATATTSRAQDELRAIQEQIFTGPNALAKQVRDTLREDAEARQREADLRLAQALLKRAVKIDALAKSSDQHAAAGSYALAAEHITLAARKAVRGAEKHPDLLVYRSARKVVTAQRAALAAAVLARAESCIAVADGGQRITVTLHRENVQFADLLAALVALEQSTESCLAGPLAGLDVLNRELVVDATLGEVTVSTRSTDGELDLPANLRRYADALALLLPPPLRATAGLAPCAALIQRYTRDVLLPRIPTSPAGLPAFSAFLGSSLDTESHFAALGLYNPAEREWSLAHFSVPRAYLAAQLHSVLARVRDLLIAPVSPETVAAAGFDEHGADDAAAVLADLPRRTALRAPLASKSPLLARGNALAFPSSAQISQTAVDVASVLDSLVAGARQVPGPDSAAEHAAHVAAVLDLYLMHTHARRRSGVGLREAMVAHNDAMFLADWCTKRCLVEAGEGEVWARALARAVPRLVQAAKDGFRRSLAARRSELVQGMRPLEGWFASGIVENRDAIAELLLQVGGEIKAQAVVLKDLIPPSLRLYWLGAMYDAALSHVLNEVLSWDDITAAESEELCSQLQTLLIPAHLFGAHDTGEDAGGIPWVPRFRAFRDTVEVLNLPLRAILDKLRAGRFRDSLAAREIAHLVAALFQDSDVRRAALAEIAEGVKSGLVRGSA